MKKQTYTNHRRWSPGFHLIAMPATLILLIGSIVNLVKSSEENLYSASLIVLMAVILMMTLFFTRFYALKAQDRALVAEEKFRYFLLTKEQMPDELSVRQIIGLRFASDAEFPALVQKAIKENLSEDAIKKSIKEWKGDYYRV